MKPETTPESKRVMLRAERKDTIAIEDGPIEEATVARRTDPYFGPKLLLHHEETGNWMLTAPGPQSQLMLWEAVTNENDFREGWEQWGEVRAGLLDTKQYDICSYCGEPIKTIDHERQSLFGACTG